MYPRRLTTLAVVVLVLACTAGVQAVDMETATVGNEGNADDTHGDGYGGVDYEYRIGTFEVTAGQYTEFLNAVAGEDTYGLYNANMADPTEWIVGCNIQRSGSSGNYTYSVADDWADRPVNWVSWGDAARFANWLHNGQPTGPQDLTTTEDGSYYLDGATSNAELTAVVREADATWVIPSEDEWYKAAYYDGASGVYYDYPTSSDSAPGYVNNSGNLSGTGTPFTEGGTDPGNYATYDGDGGTDGIGSPYYRTEVGEWENSDSPCGTFDQGGNVWEWNEAVYGPLGRGQRGGSFNFYDVFHLHAAYRTGDGAAYELVSIGFRVAEVSEQGLLIYVDDTATGANDGSGWCDAYNYLQDALASAAASGGTVNEIRVAQGIYKPDQGASQTPGDREATFQLISGVALYGGYAGLANPGDPDERDVVAYETVLTGDLNGDDGPDFENNDENSYHVVTGSGIDATAEIDGVSITGGNANGSWPRSYGGGMYNSSDSNPTVTNCTFTGNWATHGGGIYNLSSNPTVASCRFSGNSVSSEGGGMYNEGNSATVVNCTFNGNSANRGGGMFNGYDGQPTVVNCMFVGNSATYGGGIDNLCAGNATLTDCSFIANTAQYGGAIDNTESWPVLVNCMFSGNTAVNSGGAMRNQVGYPTLTNCTFSANEAGDLGGGLSNTISSLVIRNCVFWNNSDTGGTDEYAQINGATPIVTYTCIEGCTTFCTNPDNHNVGADPLFVDADGPDDDPGTPDDDLRLSPGSPCIDAADNTAVPADVADVDGDGDTTERTPLDLDGNPRFVDDPSTADTGVPDPPEYLEVVDMGAYEFQETSPPDCNGNGVDDAEDIAGGTSEDCNSNCVPDECEVPPICPDCPDCNTNGVPDECEVPPICAECPDCNGNGVPDECDPDLDEDGIPDDCDDDIDGDGVVNVEDNCVWTPNGPDLGTCVQGVTGTCQGNEDCEDDPLGLPGLCNVNQEDSDGDGLGDPCDPDADGDGVGQADNCPWTYNPGQEDSDGDGVGDACDVCPGFPDDGPDGDGDGVPDECDNCDQYNPNQTDCQPNDVGDVCDIGGGTSDDCNGNVVPDECEVPPICSWCPDCNENGTPDDCDPDADGDGVPNDCDNCNLYNPNQDDCQPNGAGDVCDITYGTSEDCTGNAIPDECEPDCNTNGVADSCDIADGTSEDCNANGTPDECIELEADCNGNAVPDACDITEGASEDCNNNGVPDECEPDEDCNTNAVQDICDIGEEVSEDCNNNSIPDECEVPPICPGCPDCNDNGTPDECDPDLDHDGIPDACDPDHDGDGIPEGDGSNPCVGGETSNCDDNCPWVFNPDQADMDSDGIGNVCDSDMDGDGWDNTDDNCPAIANSGQEDTDDDGAGDVCDNCPEVHNPSQADFDDDGLGDVCDPDVDGDGVLEVGDNCPLVFNPDQADSDEDGVGDCCDTNWVGWSDVDEDGVHDDCDNCPAVANGPGQARLCRKTH